MPFNNPGVMSIMKDMGNIAVINTIGLKAEAGMPLGQGDSSLERVFQWARQVPGVESIVFLASPEDTIVLPRGEGVTVVRKARWGERELLQVLREVSRDQGLLFYTYGDTPLLDLPLTQKLADSHRRYYAQYSFADGFPYGLAPEVINGEILSSLEKLVSQDNPPLDRRELFTVLSRDINSFDVETELAPRDLRLLRVSLAADGPANFLLLQRLFKKWEQNPGVEEICRILEQEQDILRTLPAFAELQITNRLAHRVEYLPDYPGTVVTPEGASFMEDGPFRVVLDKLQSLSRGEMTLNLGFRGEPAHHPRIAELVRDALDRPGFRILLETAGTGWDSGVVEALARLDQERIYWIVTQDSVDPGVYRELRGGDPAEVSRFLEYLLPLFPGRVWVQATRIQGREESLENFYRFWKEREVPSIIQKYDWYCGVLPDRRVTDLSPLTRFACWHLKRDLAILLDGTVLPCREVLSADAGLGNLLLDDVSGIWEGGDVLYREHLRNHYPGICEKCDEYYTFNF